MSGMEISGLVTAVGGAQISPIATLRKATLNLYQDGSYVSQIDIFVADPRIGDKFTLVVYKDAPDA